MASAFELPNVAGEPAQCQLGMAPPRKVPCQIAKGPETGCNYCGASLGGRDRVFCECKLYGFCSESCKEKHTPMHQQGGMCKESKTFMIGIGGCQKCQNGEIMVILLKVADESRHLSKKVAYVFCPRCKKQPGKGT